MSTTLDRTVSRHAAGLPERRPEVLLDPNLDEHDLDLLAVVAALAGAVPVRCPSDRGLMELARPGTVAVLADPRPALIEVLVLWGVTVVALRGDTAGFVSWLNEVVDAGASAALVRPDDEGLCLAVGAQLREAVAG